MYFIKKNTLFLSLHALDAVHGQHPNRLSIQHRSPVRNQARINLVLGPDDNDESIPGCY
jgi:hypothetical protein